MAHRCRQLAFFIGVGLMFGATAVAGASQHGAAWVLRATAAACCVAIYPSDGRVGQRHLLRAAVIIATFAYGAAISYEYGLAVQPLISVALTSAIYITAAAAPAAAQAGLLGLAAVGGMHALWSLKMALWVEGGLYFRQSAGFFNGNDLAAFLAPLCAVALTSLSKTPRVPGLLPRKGAALLLPLYAASIYVTRSRSGVLTVLIVLLVCLLGTPIRAWQKGALIGLAILLAYIAVRPRLLDTSDVYRYARRDIWQACLHILAERPMGVGTGDAADALRQHGVSMAGWVRYPRVADDAHSEYLQLLLETGVVGATALCTLGFAALRAVLAHPRRRYIAPVLIAFVVPGFVETAWRAPPVQLLLALYAGLVSRPNDDGDGDGEKTNHPWMATVALPRRRFVALWLGLWLGLATPSALSTALQDLAMREKTPAKAQVIFDRSATLAPWSLQANMAALQFRLRHGGSPYVVAQALLGLADAHPNRPAPIRAAATLLEPLAGDAAETRVIAELFEQTAERDPRNAVAWTQAGQTRIAAGDSPRAQADFLRAVKEEPACGQALAGLALLALDQGDAATAKAYADRALAAARVAALQKDTPMRRILAVDSTTVEILQKRLDEMTP